MRRLWGNCYFSSSQFCLLFLPFNFHFSSKVIPVIRFCFSCFQSGWTEAINTCDNPTAVSNWISFIFFFFRKDLQLLNWNQKLIWKSNSFLTDAHSCFLDETPIPQSNEDYTQLVQNLSLRLWLFPAKLQFQNVFRENSFCSIYLNYTFIPIVRCIVRRIIRIVGTGKIYLARKNHIVFRLPVKLSLTLLPAQISAMQKC